MPWKGNIANLWHQMVTREMLTAVARDQSVQLKVAWLCRWNLREKFTAPLGISH